MPRAHRSLRLTACGPAAAVLALTMSMGGAQADPAADALARLTELSRQAVQSRDAVTTAQRDADARLAAQTAADGKQRADQQVLEDANSRLRPFQAAADRIAAMHYTSGNTGDVAAVLTAGSPQRLLDQLSLQRAVAGQTADQMKDYRAVRQLAVAAATASEASAAAARAAAEQASAVRADLQAKWRELLRQIAAAEAQYAVLSPQQQAVVDAASVVPPAPAIAPPDDVDPSLAAAVVDLPEALPRGVASEAGLQPNTILAARAVSARFPQISTIDGVRPDSKPWHPSGLAIDIMIPSPSAPEGVALGNEILAFAMGNTGRFGIQDVIWRGTYYTPSGPQGSGYGHYDHVHITTTPRR